MNYFYGEYWAKGVIRKPMGTANHLSVPNQVFPTADGSVVIIAPSDEMWRRCAPRSTRSCSTGRSGAPSSTASGIAPK